MGGRGASSSGYKGQIKAIDAELKDLNAEIKARSKRGKQAYEAELKVSNSILAGAMKKAELRSNGYYDLITKKKRLEKTKKILERMYGSKG